LAPAPIWLRTRITLKRHEAAELALAGALAWPRMS